MSNDEIMSNDDTHSSFVIPSAFVIRYSSFEVSLSLLMPLLDKTFSVC
jgi:hypothetical protein